MCYSMSIPYPYKLNKKNGLKLCCFKEVRKLLIKFFDVLKARCLNMFINAIGNNNYTLKVCSIIRLLTIWVFLRKIIYFRVD